MHQLLQTFDNPVNISEWLSAKPALEPSFHLVGGRRLGQTIQNKRRLTFAVKAWVER